MKILCLSNKMPYPPIDGGSIATFNIIDSLVNAGNDIHLLSFNTSKHFVDEKDIPKPIKENFKLKSIYLNTKLSFLKLSINFIFSKLPYIAERFYSKKFKKELKNILSEANFDIVQIEGLYMCLYIPTIRKHSKALIAYRAHNIEHEIWKLTAANKKGKLIKFYLNNMANRILNLEKKVLNQYDLLIPITERDNEVFYNLGNRNPSLVMPAGIDYQKYETKTTSTTNKNIFHIGALDWTPNQEGLIWFIENCIPILKTSNPDIKLHIAGRNAPEWFVKKINIPEIVYHGEIDNALKFMGKYGIMIVPLLSGSGMRIKIIEGMALGKVIVSTPLGT
ncbi:MAG: glycosyltransferase family 4 protein, partial [Bacteroidales bacterium]|nr:glycosyltransferase family 4 protein [Bacteroidales bacterium]